MDAPAVARPRRRAGPLLVVDNGSAYTDDLVEVLDRLVLDGSGSGSGSGGSKRIAPADLDLGGLSGYGGFVLSGRRRNARLANAVNSKVVHHALATGTKLLGICYGAEIMALALGGTIVRSPVRRRGAHVMVRITEPTPIAPVGTMDVFESHGYEISRMPPPLGAVGESAECRYEIIRYAGRHMYGTQFHPEMSGDGRGLLARFCML